MVLEDGTGLPNADSYGALSSAKIYNADRGNDAWTNSTATVQTRALIRATDYIDATYKALGEPLSLTQALQWPRLGDYGLHPLIVKATMILALEALSGPLVATRQDRGIKQLEETGEGVGSIKTVYDDVADTDPFPIVTAMLSPIATLRTAEATPGVWYGRVVK